MYLRRKYSKYHYFIFHFFLDLSIQGTELEPEFEGTIMNVTFPAGREAVLTCSVRNLGKYKVSILNCI